MMGHRVLVASVAVLALAGGVVPAGVVHGPVQARDAALNLAPSSAWVLDYAADSCALRREFGGPDTPVVIELRQYAPDRVDFQVLAVSSHFGLKSRSTVRNLAVRYLPDAEPSPTGLAFNMQPSNGMNGITFTSTLFPAQWLSTSTDRLTAADRTARESEVVAIELVNAFREDVVLTTGSLRAPMDAMRGCLDELLTHWGIDVEAHRQLASPVLPLQMDDWARSVYDVYPSRMVQRGPLLPLRDIVVFPGMVVPLFVGRDKSVAALEAAMEASTRTSSCSPSSIRAATIPSKAMIYTIGVVAQVLQMLKLPDGTVRVLVEGTAPRRLVELRNSAMVLAQTAGWWTSPKRRRAAKRPRSCGRRSSSSANMPSSTRSWATIARPTWREIDDPGQLADTIAGNADAPRSPTSRACWPSRSAEAAGTGLWPSWKASFPCCRWSARSAAA
jgi:hypothetical protein